MATTQKINRNYLQKVTLGNTTYYFADSDLQAYVEHIRSGLSSRIDDLEALPGFDVIVADTLPTASSDTVGKLYLIPNDDASAGDYIEHVTVKRTIEGTTTYSWEQIGSTKTSLTGYATETFVRDRISELDKVTDYEARIPAVTISGQTVTVEPEGNVTLSDYTYSNVSVASGNITKSAYTPAGTIKLDSTKAAGSENKYTPAGSVAVTLKDATSNTTASLTKNAYTPTGTVTGTATTTVTPTIASRTTSATGYTRIGGTVKAPEITATMDALSIPNEGIVLANAGTLPSFTKGTYTPASLTYGDSDSFAKDGMTASINGEILVFTAANTGKASKITGFSGGSLTDPTFSRGVLPTFSAAGTSSVTPTITASSTAPTFEGYYYKVNATAATTLNDLAFAGTSANIDVTAVNYKKQVVDTATFTGTENTFNPAFTGTSANINVTGITVPNAKLTSVTPTFTGTEETITVSSKTIPAQTVDLVKKTS